MPTPDALSSLTPAAALQGIVARDLDPLEVAGAAWWCDVEVALG